MELTPKQQIVELVKSSQKILVLTHADPDGDALGSALALFLILQKLGKQVSVVCPTDTPEVFGFLPKINEIKKNFDISKDFIININCTQVELDRLGYKNYPQEKKLSIVITSKKGVFAPEHVTFSQGTNKYDLIFVLDSSDLERLGKIYEENSEIFYEMPIVNIDHHPGNDYFGKVNWVDLTATSTAEILVALTESLSREKTLLDEDIASCLLLGIITDTGSFQNPNTTPKSLTVAAQLVAAGARQQEIIQNVFKTKKLSTLKLWGRILSRVRMEADYHFVWSKAIKEDFTEFNANEEETSGVIDELLKTVPDADFVLLLSERHGGVYGSLRAIKPNVSVAEIAKTFSGGGHEKAAAFHFASSNLFSVEAEIINKIKQYQLQKYSATGASQQKQDEEIATTENIQSMNQNIPNDDIT